MIFVKLAQGETELGPNIGVVVTSGGQAPIGSGGTRTGSVRHDIDRTNQGGAVDFYLTRNGDRVNPGDDPQLYEQLIEKGATFFPASATTRAMSIWGAALPPSGGRTGTNKRQLPGSDRPICEAVGKTARDFCRVGSVNEGN